MLTLNHVKSAGTIKKENFCGIMFTKLVMTVAYKTTKSRLEMCKAIRKKKWRISKRPEYMKKMNVFSLLF